MAKIRVVAPSTQRPPPSAHIAKGTRRTGALPGTTLISGILVDVMNQWPCQEPKLQVPTIYKAYVREYPSKIWPYMVQYLHFRILEFPSNECLECQWFIVSLIIISIINGNVRS